MEIKDRRAELKIKIKSLAAEARIIRAERYKGKVLPPSEEDARPPYFEKDGEFYYNNQPRRKKKYFYSEEQRNRFYRHHIDVVRTEARASQLAYGFLRGRTYERLEGNSKPVPKWYPMWDKIRAMVKSFGDGTPEQKAELELWIAKAQDR